MFPKMAPEFIQQNLYSIRRSDFEETLLAVDEDAIVLPRGVVDVEFVVDRVGACSFVKKITKITPGTKRIETMVNEVKLITVIRRDLGGFGSKSGSGGGDRIRIV